MVTQFPSVLQLLPEFSGRPSTKLIPSQGSQREEPVNSFFYVFFAFLAVTPDVFQSAAPACTLAFGL
jgi:hypothetical protein